MKRRIAFGLLTAALVSTIGSGAQAQQFREVIVNSPALLPLPVAAAPACGTVTSAVTVEGSPILLERLPAHLSIQRMGFDRFFHSF